MPGYGSGRVALQKRRAEAKPPTAPSLYATHIMQTTVFELGNTTRSPKSRQHQEDRVSEGAETRLEQSRLPESRCDTTRTSGVGYYCTSSCPPSARVRTSKRADGRTVTQITAQMLRWRGRPPLSPSPSFSRLSLSILARPVTLRGSAARMSTTIPPAPAFKPFNLALIQLGQIGADKRANLEHARDMIRRAAGGEGVGGAQGRPDLIVLPVSGAGLFHGAKRERLKVVCLSC